MSKYIYYIALGLLGLCIALGLMYRNEHQIRTKTEQDLCNANEAIELQQKYQEEKDAKFIEVQKKYQEILQKYKFTGCDTQIISEELYQALREF